MINLISNWTTGSAKTEGWNILSLINLVNYFLSRNTVLSINICSKNIEKMQPLHIVKQISLLGQPDSITTCI